MSGRGQKRKNSETPETAPPSKHWKKTLIQRHHQHQRMQATVICNKYIALSKMKLANLKEDNGQGKLMKKMFIAKLIHNLTQMKVNC